MTLNLSYNNYNTYENIIMTARLPLINLKRQSNSFFNQFFLQSCMLTCACGFFFFLLSMMAIECSICITCKNKLCWTTQCNFTATYNQFLMENLVAWCTPEVCFRVCVDKIEMLVTRLQLRPSKLIPLNVSLHMLPLDGSKALLRMYRLNVKSKHV